MNLSTLKATCAAYLEKAPADFSVNGIDLFLIAANNARRGAELRHNFEMSRITATISIAGVDGGALADAVITGEANAGVKEVVALWRSRENGTLVPLDFTRSDIALERDRSELEFDDNLWPANRYPSDAQLLMSGTSGGIIQRGRKLYVYPAGTTTTDPFEINIEGYGWLPRYTAAGTGAAEDFVVEYGWEYMQWAIIVELNQLVRQYVPRQEGNLSPPVEAKAAAWRDFLIWDAYAVDSNVTRSR